MTRTTIADVAKAAENIRLHRIPSTAWTGQSQPETENVSKKRPTVSTSPSPKSASSLASGKTMRIAVLLPSEISSWFNSHAFKGIYEVMSKADYDVVPIVTDAVKIWIISSRICQAIAMSTQSSKHPSTSTRQIAGTRRTDHPVVGMNAPSTHGLDAESQSMTRRP